MLYPGAMHTRFEHSLGVMHTATMLYDSIVERSAEVLKTEFAYNDDGLKRDRQLVRLAALLHDVGHGPFSHASEELLPTNSQGRPYEHENYSAAIIRRHLRSAIEDHRLNANYSFSAEDVAALLEGATTSKQRLFWRNLLVGQMDADRMDYLLRDSAHIGVRYGSFDLHRIVNTIQAVPGSEGEAPRLGIDEGGWHAAEGLVLARYFMFTQVYFHRTRVAFDVHLRGTLKELLPGGTFPNPTADHIDEFLRWDDWRVLGDLSNGKGGEHGDRLRTRDHYREAYHTPEVCTFEDLERLAKVRAGLGALLVAEVPASKSWYKTKPEEDIPVVSGMAHTKSKPLSAYSTVLANLKPANQVLLYVRPESVHEAADIVAQCGG